jgi:hypothetical protein
MDNKRVHSINVLKQLRDRRLVSNNQFMTQKWLFLKDNRGTVSNSLCPYAIGFSFPFLLYGMIFIILHNQAS